MRGREVTGNKKNQHPRLPEKFIAHGFLHLAAVPECWIHADRHVAQGMVRGDLTTPLLRPSGSALVGQEQDWTPYHEIGVAMGLILFARTF